MLKGWQEVGRSAQVPRRERNIVVKLGEGEGFSAWLRHDTAQLWVYAPQSLKKEGNRTSFRAAVLVGVQSTLQDVLCTESASPMKSICCLCCQGCEQHLLACMISSCCLEVVVVTITGCSCGKVFDHRSFTAPATCCLFPCPDIN